MTRYCFTLQVHPDMLDDYIARHSPVWPEMLAEIAAAGRHNYSLFHAGNGMLIGYYECDDDAAAKAYLAASDIATRWEAEMAPYFIGLKGRPDQDVPHFPEIFHLGDQLATASKESETP